MRQLSPLAILAALLTLQGAARADCRATALQVLAREAPDGYTIFKASRPDFFESWIDCGDPQFDLSTAVHESTHFVTGETDTFPLVGGGSIARPHEVSAFMPPYRIAGRFASDDFTAVYLTRGKASSATDFLYLLDELNAYSHDLATAVALKARRSREDTVDHRDGLAATMSFVVAYADAARESDAETWRGLRRPNVANAIDAIWTHAEHVMESSCGISNFGVNDKAYIQRVCAAGPRSALASLIGRTPACPTACLAPDVATTADEVVSDELDPEMAPTASTHRGSTEETAPDDQPVSDLPRHPFALIRHRASP